MNALLRSLLKLVLFVFILLAIGPVSGSPQPKSGHIYIMQLNGGEVKALLHACSKFSTDARTSCNSPAMEKYRADISEEGDAYFVSFWQPGTGGRSEYLYKIDKTTFGISRYYSDMRFEK